MQKILLSYFFLFSLLVFSQKYHFNYFTLYDSEIHENGSVYKSQHENIFNTVDHKYTLLFDINPKASSTAAIIDFKNNIRHIFKLRNINFPLKEDYFEYQYSIKFPNFDKQSKEEFSRRFFRTNLLEETSEFSKFSIQECRNENMTKCASDATVVFSPFKDDLASDGLRYLFDYHDVSMKVKFSKKYILKSATIAYGKRIRKLTLVDVKELNLNLVVPPTMIKIKN